MPGVFLEIFLRERKSEPQSGEEREKKKNFKKNVWDQGAPGCADKQHFRKKEKEMIDILINFPKFFWLDDILAFTQIKLFSPNAVGARQNTIVFPGEWGALPYWA